MTSGRSAVYLNADVTTLDPTMPRARGLVVEDGKVGRVLDGRPSGLPKDVEVVDCNGAAIVPGFHDCHVHLTDTGLLAGDHDFTDCPDVESMLKRVAALSDAILFAGNYEDHNIAEGRPPTMLELDSVAGARPVLLTRIDGHSCVVNSAALQRIDVGHLEGVERDDDGEPTGRLFGPANYAGQAVFLRAVPDEAKRRADERAAQMALAGGITTVHHVIAWDPPLETLEAQYRADAALPLRVISKACTTDVRKARRLGGRVFGGDIFVDGSIGSRTAAVEKDYCDSHDAGLLYLDRAQLTEVFDEAAEGGLSVGVHAIGDRAIEEAIAAWEAVIKKRGPLRAVRPSIDHFEIARADQIARAARCRMLLSIQPVFDLLWGGDDGMYAQRLGADRAREMNLFKTAKRAGCVICAGSDSPVTKFSALLGIQALVDHHVPAERFTVEEALRAYCSDAAKLSFDEGRRGVLAPGMDADFVLLERSLDSIAPKEIGSTRVIATVVGGTVRFRA
ncbi:MAG TPA: amidohydrolase [Candidatus Eremiobacteraceae bacterium]|nr:amidohydrolase [Candidatus Eremiobacteraceae bacterium]